MMIDLSDPATLIGVEVAATDGAPMGRVASVYVADGEAVWVTVRAARLGSTDTFVPLAGAEPDGDRLTVPYRAEQIERSPRLDDETGQLSEQEEAELSGHYGLPYRHPMRQRPQSPDAGPVTGPAGTSSARTE